LTRSLSVRQDRAANVALLLAAFTGSVAIRVGVAGPARTTSVAAAVAFGVLLGGLAAACRVGFRLDRRAVVVGIGTGVALVVPVLVSVAARGVLPVGAAGSFATFGVLTVAVAGAEEAFLRGALFDAVTRWRGSNLAVVVAAVAFALLHVPLYGWHAVPLDLAVGVALGAARLLAGSWTAPAIAHIGADLAGWWLI
jgi:membrane protease YdiL (CAAX protease family)